MIAPALPTLPTAEALLVAHSRYYEHLRLSTPRARPFSISISSQMKPDSKILNLEIILIGLHSVCYMPYFQLVLRMAGHRSEHLPAGSLKTAQRTPLRISYDSIRGDRFLIIPRKAYFLFESQSVCIDRSRSRLCAFVGGHEQKSRRLFTRNRHVLGTGIDLHVDTGNTCTQYVCTKSRESDQKFHRPHVLSDMSHFHIE